MAASYHEAAIVEDIPLGKSEESVIRNERSLGERQRIAWRSLKGIVRARFHRESSLREVEVKPRPRVARQDRKKTVAIVRRPQLKEMLQRAVELAGGMSIEAGDTVLIKPNQNSDDPFPATSNPATVAALVEYVKRFEPARIVVADASFVAFLPTLETMRKTGVLQAAQEAGAEVLAIEDGDFVTVLPEEARYLEPVAIAKIFLDADYVISQPVVKTHKYAVFSMSLKNTIGVVKTEDRPLMHHVPDDDFRKMVAELNLIRPVDFVLLDGQKAMVTGGPFRGVVTEANLLIASKDQVAVDVVGLAVLKHLGTTERIRKASVWATRRPRVL